MPGGRDFTTDVAIVGAGPTGLLLALALAKLGVRFVVLDGKNEPTRESRALVIQARSMEIFDQLGIADAVLARATTATSFRPGFENRSVATVDLRQPAAQVSSFPHVYLLEQSVTEQILVEALSELGEAVLWGHSVTAILDTGIGVEITSAAPNGETSAITARYCVGADGSSSAVRKLLEIPFEGTTYAHTFFVIDAVGVTGLVPGAIAVRPGDRDFLLGFPMGAPGRARLLGTVRGDPAVHARHSTRSEAMPGATEPAIRDLLARVFDVGYDRAEWFSTYRVHHRVAARFSDGPVFLAGDAAHVHSPVGGQGMNTGLQDAHNLACALADVIGGGAPESRLDRYEAERRPVARRLVATTDTLFGFITSEQRMPRLARRVLVSSVAPLVEAAVRRLPRPSLLFEYLSQTRIHYWMTSDAKTAAHGRRHPVVGRRLPWNGDNYDCLRDFRWQVHSYGTTVRDTAQRTTSGPLPVRHFPVIRNRRLDPGLLYLVRPDGFVAAAARPESAVDAFLAAGPVIR